QPALAHQPAVDDALDDVDVDVAAGQDHHGHVVRRRADLAGEERGEGDGAGALGNDLLALDQQVDGGRDLTLGDGDDVVDVPLDQRVGPLADPLDRDAVRDGLRRLDVDERVRL